LLQLAFLHPMPLLSDGGCLISATFAHFARR
jgi:hypothetical protein